MIVNHIPTVQQGIRNPRNLKPVSNIKEKVDRDSRLSTDYIDNFIEQCHFVESGNFARGVLIYPDLVSVFVHEALAKE